jgi:hypothetical protein
VSSAILYFAIVAIWVGVLMPKWLRPAQPQQFRMEAQGQDDLMVAAAPPAEQRDTPERESRRRDVPQQPGRPDPGDTRQRRQVTAEQPAPVAGSGPEAAPRRASVLRARRRMLGTLVALTVGAFVIALTHLAAVWVVVPPAVVLGFFMLLLRDAARTDAERARRPAQAAAAARSRDEVQFERQEMRPERPDRAEDEAAESPAVPEVAQAEPAAEITHQAQIIDISARVSDQLYDQYTDAAERAVGD